MSALPLNYDILFPLESCAELSPEDSSSDRLTFYHFDISRLLKHGASLLGSAGAEYELQDDKAGLYYFFVYLFVKSAVIFYQTQTYNRSWHPWSCIYYCILVI